MKVKIFLLAASVVLFCTTSVSAWCITQIIKVHKPELNILVTDITTGKYHLVINADSEDSLQIIKFFQVSNVDNLIGLCHQEGEEWNRAPMVIKKIDQAILLLFKPAQKEKDSI